MDRHVGIDLSTPTAASTFAEFCRRIQGSVCVYVLFKPHHPYYKFTPFNIIRVDAFTNIIHGLLDCSTGDLPTQATMYYANGNVHIRLQNIEIVVDKLFINPCQLLERPISTSTASKRTFSQL